MMRSRVLVTVLLCACNPNPSLEEAREYYAAHRGTIEAVEEDLRRAFEALPSAAACKRDRECELHAVEARNDGLLAIRRDMLDVLDRPQVLGLEALDGHEQLLRIGVTPGGHAHGRVPASEQRLTIDEKRVGWGAYQTAVSSNGRSVGDGEMRHGIEVQWARADGPQPFTATLFLLAKDETTEDWRAAMKEWAQ